MANIDMDSPAPPQSPPTPAPSPTPAHRRPARGPAGRSHASSTTGPPPASPPPHAFALPAWHKGGPRPEPDEDADEMEAFIRSAKCYFLGLSHARDRRRFMAEMLDLCDSQLLSFVNEFIGPRLKKDPFSVMPNELCLRILSFIDDPTTLARASQVSSRWHELLNDDLTWKLLCEKHAYRRDSIEDATTVNSPDRADDSHLLTARAFVSPDLRDVSRLSASAGATTPSLADSTDSDSCSRPRKRQKARSYRSHFKRKYLVDAAWRKGGKSITHHVTPDQAVVTSLHMTDKYIVVALDNAKIYIYAPDGTFLRSLKGHMMGVWAMVPSGDTLVSGGCDRDVRVWDMDTGKSLHKMRGHTSTIRCLKMYDARTAISGSRDTTVRVWDIERGEVKHVLQGHSASVRCLAIHGERLVSGSYDTTARVWNVPEARCEHVLSGHFSQIYAIAFDGRRVVTGSLDTSVRVWDPATGACLTTLQGHTALVGKLQMRGDTLVTGGSDGSIRVWSLTRYQPIHRLVAHDNSITSLQFDDKRIVSGGSDGCVKIWDLHSGALIRELGHTADAIWRVAFREETAVTMVTRSGRTYMEVWDFSAPEDTVADEADYLYRRRRIQPARTRGAPLASVAAAAGAPQDLPSSAPTVNVDSLPPLAPTTAVVASPALRAISGMPTASTSRSSPRPSSAPTSTPPTHPTEPAPLSASSAAMPSRGRASTTMQAVLGSAGYFIGSDYDMQDASS
ncbi:hypothetical protein KEM52_000521 [Ascosphaera acerosa]|nr:hypothetical protein KEM52_000521 [Ascosphaera acerosa]